jgi:hypothetical protein
MSTSIETAGWPTALAEAAKREPAGFAMRAEYTPGHWFMGLHRFKRTPHFYEGPIERTSGGEWDGWEIVRPLCGRDRAHLLLAAPPEMPVVPVFRIAHHDGHWKRCKHCSRIVARRAAA